MSPSRYREGAVCSVRTIIKRSATNPSRGDQFKSYLVLVLYQDGAVDLVVFKTGNHPEIVSNFKNVDATSSPRNHGTPRFHGNLDTYRSEKSRMVGADTADTFVLTDAVKKEGGKWGCFECKKGEARTFNLHAKCGT